MEIMDEYRCSGDYLPLRGMPKSFLMSGKRRETVEILYKQNDSHENGHPGSPSPHSNDHLSISPRSKDDSLSPHKHSPFSPSHESAFNKIERNHYEQSTSNSSPPSTSGFPGIYPGLYPSLFPYPVSSLTGDKDTPPTPLAFPYLYPPMSLPTALDTKNHAESPDKSMFYYVDPRIPFTNYFLNLTRLLNNNKNSPVNTPLGKMTDETRADDRDPPVSPDSPRSVAMETSEASERREPEAPSYSPEPEKTSHGIKTPPLELPGKLHIQTYPESQFPSPYSHPLLPVGHTTPMLPIPGAGLFPSAMMHLPGSSGYRRFNPEKPPPVKKYKCDVCGKAFSRSNTLVTHKRIHTGDKPFKCEICSRAFRQPGNLTRHRLTHTTVKPYVCPTCNKAFNRASNLHTHMRTHTNFKAFICPYCGKGFHQKIDMKIHCYTHTAHANRVEPARM